VIKQLSEYSNSSYIKGLALGTIGFCSRWAVAGRGHRKEWMEVNELELNLSEEFNRKVPKAKIVHISDLHCSRTVSLGYLHRCIDRINKLNPDLILLTGDYITHDYAGRFAKKVTGLLTRLDSKYGVYGCLGNHDYGLGGFLKNNKDKHKTAAMKRQLSFAGIKLLVNETTEIEINSRRLNIAGLGDIWANDFEPEKTFKNTDRTIPVITLVHNPEAVKKLRNIDTELILSGHTHGTKFEWEVKPGRIITHKRNYPAGLYNRKSGKLYVNRGLGRHGRIGFNTRPEITVLNIK
jgi:hypothetical protein